MTWALYLLVLVAGLILAVIVHLTSVLSQVLARLEVVSRQVQEISGKADDVQSGVDKILEVCELGFAEQIDTQWKKTQAELKKDGIDV
jgi:predicted phage-related endonuclease